MKKIACIAILCIFISIMSIPISAHAVTNESDEVLITDAFKTMLTKAIDDAIVGHYGKREKSFGIHDVKIKEIKRLMQGGYSFLCKVEVSTYEGPHHPPYGLEIITFEIGPAGVSVVEYLHKDVP